MTVEATRTESRFFGLRKTTKTRLLDFRGYDEKKNEVMTIIGRPDTIMLQGGRKTIKRMMKERGSNAYVSIHEIEYVFVDAISEDEVETRRSIGFDLERAETTVYSREEINEANLVSEDGERISWRPTEESDYPPLKPGQEAWPIQMSLGVTDRRDVFVSHLNFAHERNMQRLEE